MSQQPTKNALLVTALTGFIRAFLLDDIRILREMGYTVHCAANSAGDDMTSEENAAFFEKMNVKFVDIPFSSSNPVCVDNYKAYKDIKKMLKECDYGLIHVHTPIPGALVRIAARRSKNTVVIYTTHGFYFHKYSSKKSWIVFRTIESIMSKYCDAIITINKEDYTNAKKMHCKNIYYINGVGVETKRFINCGANRKNVRESLGLKSQHIAILSVGELSKRKNHQIVIKALHEIGNENLVYLICGKIVEGRGTYNDLAVLAETLNVDVRFLGYRTDIPEIVKAADIGAIPSLREGLGLAGIEMLAGGIPLAASNVHGIADYVIEGVTGYSASPYDVESYATAIRNLLDEDKRQSMKLECVKMAQNFDISKSHQQRAEIYRKLLCNHL